MKFIDSVLLTTSGKNIKIPAGSYENLNFRFAGAQSGATPPTEANFGTLDIYYRGQNRAHILVSELGAYDLKKGGTREATASVNNLDPFAYNYIWYNSHPDDKQNILHVKEENECYVLWTPTSDLAARVSAASALRIVGSEKMGVMNYFYGWKRNDVAMVAGETTPQDILPYNVAALFVEYSANIDNLDLTVDGRLDHQSSEIVEILNQDLHRNRIETYAASGYAEIDLIKTKNPLEALSNNVKLILRGSAADTISVFWQYFDYTPMAKQVSEADFVSLRDNILTRKATTGGSGAVAVVTARQLKF